MKKYNLDFSFKGSRKYVQGPDIFDFAILRLKEKFNIHKIYDIKYSAYKMLHFNANMIITNDFNQKDYKDINSLITFSYKDKKYFVIIQENSQEIKGSVEYSEEIVQSNSLIDNKYISFKNSLNDSLTELIVSMNKYFLQQTITKDGKWIVTKFEYKRLQSNDFIKNKTIKLELTNNFNNKLTRSRVFVDEIEIGNLYFSLV